MKKKILAVLLVFVGIFTLSACAKNKDEELNGSTHPNQIGYVEGQYSIDDLTFNLYDGFAKIDENNSYQLLNDLNGIRIAFYHDKDVNTSLGEYIDSDPHEFYPNQKTINPKTINGNEWYTGVTSDNVYVYYHLVGTEVYSFSIMPMYTTSSVLNEVISTLENSLYFKTK